MPGQDHGQAGRKGHDLDDQFEQFRLGELAIACALRRQRGLDEKVLLSAHVPRVGKNRALSRREWARFHYFVASCLREHDPVAANRYYRRALFDNPLHIKALWRCITGRP